MDASFQSEGYVGMAERVHRIENETPDRFRREVTEISNKWTTRRAATLVC